MTRFVVVDTETTGTDPEIDRVVEIGAAALLPGFEPNVWRATKFRASLINPGRPIPPEASAVHHLVDADVVDAPSLSDAIRQCRVHISTGRESKTLTRT